MAETGWFQTRKIYSFRVLEAARLKSRCWQGCTGPLGPPSRALGENLFHAFLLASGVPGKSLVFLGFQLHNFRLCPHHHMAFSCVSLSSPPLIRTPWIRAHPADLILIYYIHKDPTSKEDHIHRYWVLGFGKSFWGHNSTHNRLISYD